MSLLKHHPWLKPQLTPYNIIQIAAVERLTDIFKQCGIRLNPILSMQLKLLFIGSELYISLLTLQIE